MSKKNIKRLSEILGFKIPIDGFMTMIMQKTIIDILKLDEILIKNYRYKGNMNDFIKSKFGEEAFRIFEDNIA